MAQRILVAKPDAELDFVSGPLEVTADGTQVTRFRTKHGKIFERVTFPSGEVRWFLVVE